MSSLLTSKISEAEARDEIPARPGRKKQHPLWLWPNLLSLDAPIIAVLWAALFARCFRTEITPGSLAAFGMGVWILYIADRLLDCARNAPESFQTERHRFYRANARGMLFWSVLIALATIAMSFTFLRPALLRNFLYLAVVVSAYFAVVHMAPNKIKSHWPKEFAVAILFAAGVCLAAWTSLKSGEVRFGIASLLFAGLLWVNADGIEYWERKRSSFIRPNPGAWSSRLLAQNLGPAAVFIGTASACTAFLGFHAATQPIYLSISLSAFCLAALEWKSRSLTAEQLRVLADACLLSPLVFLPFVLAR